MSSGPSENQYVKEALEEENGTANSSDNSEFDSQGQESEIDSNVETTVESDNDSGNTETESTGQPKINPNWNEALQHVPEAYHQQLIPAFDKWDKNNNSRLEKVQQQYAPYQPLIDNEVPMEEIQKSYALRQVILNNPEEVFHKLAEQLGYDLNNAADNGDSSSQGQSEEIEDDPVFKDPRFQQLQSTTQMLQQKVEADAQAEEEKRMYQDTVKELDSLEDTYGKFDRNRAVQFSLWEQQRTGKPLSLKAGVEAMMEYNDSVRKSSVNNSAPDVFSGNGNLPSGRVDTRNMTEEQVDEYTNHLLKARAQGK